MNELNENAKLFLKTFALDCLKVEYIFGMRLSAFFARCTCIGAIALGTLIFFQIRGLSLQQALP